MRKATLVAARGAAVAQRPWQSAGQVRRLVTLAFLFSCSMVAGGTSAEAQAQDIGTLIANLRESQDLIGLSLVVGLVLFAAITAFANHIKEYPGTEHAEELSYLTIKAYYLLALKSIDSKKQERFRAAIDSYTKFAETYPKSTYLRDAEFIYDSALKGLEKYNKSTS